MKKLSKEEIEIHYKEIELFAKLTFEKSTDYPLVLSIVNNVGINSLFPCGIPYEYKKEIHYCDMDETSFLFIALFCENEEMIRFLLENGADPNGTLSDGEPPIWDIQYEYKNEDQGYGLRVAKMLLEYGADPNIKWEDDEFYYYIDTKPADIIESKKELDYLMNLCNLLEEYGGEFSWNRNGENED